MKDRFINFWVMILSVSILLICIFQINWYDIKNSFNKEELKKEIIYDLTDIQYHNIKPKLCINNDLTIKYLSDKNYYVFLSNIPTLYEINMVNEFRVNPYIFCSNEFWNTLFSDTVNIYKKMNMNNDEYRLLIKKENDDIGNFLLLNKDKFKNYHLIK